MKQLYIRCGAVVSISEKNYKRLKELVDASDGCNKKQAEELLLKLIAAKGKIDLDSFMYLPGRYLYLDNPNTLQFEFNRKEK